jgi:RNA polymerase sigma factor (TIGR02999 family)
MPDITQILCAIEQGDPRAAEQLLPLVYEELHRLAAQKMAQERPGQTLQPTALVREAYLRLVASAQPDPRWDSRRHFFAAAAEAMRRILVESARRKRRIKHGEGRIRIDLEDCCSPAESADEVDLIALDEALSRLSADAPAKAELVKLRFFGGLTMVEASEVLGVSLTTAERYWTYARTWLYAELADTQETSPISSEFPA